MGTTTSTAFYSSCCISNIVEFGAGNETRTRDPDLGKVVLYQLSYSRPAYRWLNVNKFFIGTGCALYEKSFLPQAPESKKTGILFDCCFKRQHGELSARKALKDPTRRLKLNEMLAVIRQFRYRFTDIVQRLMRPLLFETRQNFRLPAASQLF